MPVEGSRAPQACLSCRSRKTRCDVVKKGSPCTNCYRAQRECTVMANSRVKYTRTNGKLTACNEALSDKSQDINSGSIELRDGPGENADCEGNGPRVACQSPAQRVAECLPTIPNPQSDPNQLIHDSYGVKDWPQSRPAYIKRLPPQLQDDDLRALQANGALEIPTNTLRDNLIKGYMLYIHPYMPVLDTDGFFQAVYDESNSNPVSLLLFQAMMFAGVAFCDKQHLREAGFSTKREARKCFYQRAKMLYSAGSENDDLSLVQALLLLSLWSECVDDPEGPKYWISLCLQVARTIGLNKDSRAQQCNARYRRLCRRIWWSIYVREKQIGIGFRQQAMIMDTECDVPLFTLGDFESGPIPPRVLHSLNGLSGVYDSENQHKLAVLFTEQTKLSICISDIIAAQYTADGRPIGGIGKMTLLPKRIVIDENELRRCDRLLQQWFENIPNEVRYKPASISSLPSERDRVIYLHSAVLTLMYHAATSALHRPAVTSLDSQISCGTMALSQSRVCPAGSEIATICKNLQDLELTQYLSTTATTFLLPAMTTLIMNIQSKGPDSYLEQFHNCEKVLFQLQDAYPLAEEALNLVGFAAMQAGVDMHIFPQEP